MLHQVAVAACPGATTDAEPIGMEQLLHCIALHTPVPNRCIVGSPVIEALQ